jgi:hypothetical protein
MSNNPSMGATPKKKLGFDICQFCGKEFETEETLAIHVQYEHLDDEDQAES